MICVKCGSSSSDIDAACSSCGEPLITFAPAPVDAQASAAALDADYAGFWRRLAAVFLDGIVLTILCLPLALALGFVAGRLGLGNSPTISAGINLFSLIASAAYYIAMESSEQGATYGKRWVNIRVVDVFGERISKGRAFARWASHLFSYLTVLIGFIIQPFTAKKQTLHDKIAGTLIVRTGQDSGLVTVIVAVVALVFMLALAGIIAAIAIPAYQQYVVKAKAARAFEIGNNATRAVETYYLKTGRIPGSIAETDALLATSPDVSGVVVNANTGEVRILLSDSLIPSPLSRKHFSLMPSQRQDGSIEWKCESDIAPQYLPPACR